ncbi:MAG: DUF4277 domain-containing protein [Cyanothece sp. SIO1E1]|nr:DUF4277 domain-containing protein [Cyanothece sp. SIO1E1]
MVGDEMQGRAGVWLIAPLYLFEHFFQGKATEPLLGPGALIRSVLPKSVRSPSLTIGLICESAVELIWGGAIAHESLKYMDDHPASGTKL